MCLCFESTLFVSLSCGRGHEDMGGLYLQQDHWSNAKAQWAVARPMDCEERLVQQAELTAAATRGITRTFVCTSCPRDGP